MDKQVRPLRLANRPWKEVADRLYCSDKRRFRHLVGWIKKAELVYGGAIIRNTLLALEVVERRNGPVDDWYPYLTRLIEKEQVRVNIRHAEAEHERYKAEERDWLGETKRDLRGVVRTIAQKKMK